jgi:hypothetical protein
LSSPPVGGCPINYAWNRIECTCKKCDQCKTA